jgi:hypothetical protein
VSNFITEEVLSEKEIFVVADINLFSGSLTKSDNLKFIADTLNMKFWYKTDFNNDRVTDLLAYGGSTLYFIEGPKIVAIISNNSTDYSLKILDIKGYGQVFPVVSKMNNTVFLINYYAMKDLINGLLNYKLIYNQEDITKAFNNNHPIVCADTLVYKFENFVEYNSSPKKKNVNKIEFEKNCSAHEREKVNITINSSGISQLTVFNNDTISLRHSGIIKKEYLEEIYSIINYLNFDILVPSYTGWVTRKIYDKYLYSLNIYYDPDKLLSISDNGTGPYILEILNKKLTDLKNLNFWEIQN